ncbi:hypothetical protein G7Y89_g4955 [Cudoniella acicularis]|uniref:Sodium/calcium exchanger membrane region domain-containing protein n=1 Tax=Cudoniella acicularis TaxID=354080 RepID=A0A8H4W4G0_9HELO|nr:hypothetical protein G7Y89_g4955 [Cudoniella acicularis]
MSRSPESPTSSTGTDSTPSTPSEWGASSPFGTTFSAPPFSPYQRSNSNPQPISPRREDSAFSSRNPLKYQTSSAKHPYGEGKAAVPKRHTNPNHVNGYTECGRHSDDWLFGGLSVVGMVKGAGREFEDECLGPGFYDNDEMPNRLPLAIIVEQLGRGTPQWQTQKSCNSVSGRVLRAVLMTIDQPLELSGVCGQDALVVDVEDALVQLRKAVQDFGNGHHENSRGTRSRRGITALSSHAKEDLLYRLWFAQTGPGAVKEGRQFQLEVESVSTVALFKGEIRIVQSSMLGAILSNVLLGLGVCLTIGGLHHDCYFNATAASTMSSLMAVSSISLMIPTALTFAFNSANHSASDSLSSILILSRGTAIILLILYALYLYFQLVTHSKFFEEGSAPGSPTKGQNGTPIPEKPSFKEKEVDEPKFQILTPTQALATLFALSSLIAICAEYLVSAIDDVVLALHIPKPFIGLIILPLVGNFAEYLSAALAARKQKMDLALTIALGSSMQISLLITPTLVLLGWVISQPMSLSFEPFGAVVFFLSVIVVAGLVDDGESNYLEGSISSSQSPSLFSPTNRPEQSRTRARINIQVPPSPPRDRKTKTIDKRNYYQTYQQENSRRSSATKSHSYAKLCRTTEGGKNEDPILTHLEEATVAVLAPTVVKNHHPVPLSKQARREFNPHLLKKNPAKPYSHQSNRCHSLTQLTLSHFTYPANQPTTQPPSSGVGSWKFQVFSGKPPVLTHVKISMNIPAKVTHFK